MTMVRRADPHRPPRRARGRVGISVLLLAKIVSGALLLLVLVQTLQFASASQARQGLLARWVVTAPYAVFFPHHNGNDLEEFENDGHATKIAEAGELYSALDDAGAIFIDASAYRKGVPASPWLPAAPIRVNANYLDAFPILDDDGARISVAQDEEAWIVLVPSEYRSREAEIVRHFQGSRVGDGEREGVAQAQASLLGVPAPERFRDQAVRIVWTAPHQDVFAFDATVEVERGNLVRDPIIEVMTAANSVVVDRLNSITGEINTALKVHVDRDAQTTLRELGPTLRRLGLEDNLIELVDANEAVLVELAGLRAAVAWSAGIAGVALLLLLALSVSFIAVFSDGRRRTLAVRRVQGFGLVRAHRELFAIVGIVWVAQVLLALAMLAARGGSGAPASEDLSLANGLPGLLLLSPAVLVAELVLALTTATILERRSAVRRLKEL